MKTTPEFALDANIILRYLLKDNESLYTKAERIFSSIEAGDIIALLDPVNLAEAVWVMQSFYKLPPADISSVLESLLSSPFVVIEQKNQYLTALRLYAEGLHHFGDACACAAAREKCKGHILSFDRKLSGVPGIFRSERV